MYWKPPGSDSTPINTNVSPDGNVTDYVIYYQSKGGPVISDTVNGSETEKHSLDGLQRGVTYYISIVAVSEFLPSPLVGPYIIQSKSHFPFPNHFLLSHFQLQQSLRISLPLCQSTAIRMSMLLSLGSQQMTPSPLAISSTMSMIIWKNRSTSMKMIQTLTY